MRSYAICRFLPTDNANVAHFIKYDAHTGYFFYICEFTLFVCKCIEYIPEDEILFLRKGVAKQICTNPQPVWCISVFSLY